MEILFRTSLFPATKCQLHYHFYQSALENLMVHIQFRHYARSQLVFHCYFLCNENPFGSWSVCTPHLVWSHTPSTELHTGNLHPFITQMIYN